MRVSGTLWGVGRTSKRSARKAQLVQTALEAIQQRGIEGLRIRDVAEAAGVSTATVHYYFDDIDGLWTEVHAVAVDRFSTDRQVALAPHKDAREKLEVMIRGGVPESPDDPVTVALYHIDNAKRADPLGALLRTRSFDQQVMLYVGILELGVGQGHFTLVEPVLDIARNLVALEDAYCMHIIERNASLSPDLCLELMFSYARSATGCPELGARTDETAAQPES
jgi:AcrR family transcriptional regulator